VVLAVLLLGVVVVGLVLSGLLAQVHRWATSVTHLGSASSGASSLDSGAFASGACVAYPPTVGNNHKTVFLDAGHGGIDPGAVGTTLSGQQVDESTVNLAIELDTMSLLRARGFRVVVSRTEDTTVAHLVPVDKSGGVLSLQGAHDDVVARDTCANLARADVLVGIYMDASGSSQTAGSVTVYDAARSFAQSNAALARSLQTTVLTAMNDEGWQIPDDGAVPDTGFGSSVGDPSAGGLAAEAGAYDHLLLIGPPAAGFFSSPSAMPGAVIEPLYLTDPFEASIATNSADQAVMAQGIANAIRQFLVPSSAP
jgi:N-acetylmuramoyl-L-alanine amidase